MLKNNQKLSKEKLLAEIECLKKELKKRKKYGLVWEEKPEEVVEMCKEKLPVLKEVKNKEIITDKNKPVNLLIEGDNFHALSVLNYTHAKKVDVIYIDPPYNTGNKDFIFNDRYVDREDAYRHSKWLAFMEKRLKLAKNLLKDTGVIFISIDDNEMPQLKLLMDDKNRGMFGENNFLATICWQSTDTLRNDAKHFSANSEYILVYARNKSVCKIKGILKGEKQRSYYKNYDNDPRGPYLLTPLHAKSGTSASLYEYKFKNRQTWKAPMGTFPRFSKETLMKLEKEGRIWLDPKGAKVPQRKTYLLEIGDRMPAWTFWRYEDFGSTRQSNQELSELLNKGVFSNPKPSKLVKSIIDLIIDKSGIILDFFAGSGTTGHAVLELNKDGGSRKFILCTDNQDNNGSGLRIATNICYPRVKKVIEGYKNLKGEKVAGLGGNLKYFKTDFVDYDEPTDKNKIKLTEQATEMLCVKEGTFEEVLPARRSNGAGGDQKNFKIFKNTNHYTGIIFDQAAIPAFKKEIKDIKGKFSVYIFSLGDEDFSEEFADLNKKRSEAKSRTELGSGVRIQLSPIPEAILRVYRRIFK